MGLMKRESMEWARLKRLSKGTSIKLSRNDIGNVRISGKGYEPISKQLGGNVGLSATAIVSARRRIEMKILENRRLGRKAW